MKPLIRLVSLTVLLVAFLLPVPEANTAAISKAATLAPAAAAELEKDPAAPKAISTKPSVRSLPKGTPPRLKPKGLAQPQKTTIGRPQQVPGAGGLGEEIPIPNDSEVGISLPGSESSALTVGGADDKHEQEADDVADRIMSNPKPKTARGLSPGTEVGKKPDSDPAGPVSNQMAPGSAVSLDPRDDPGGPVSNLGSPGADVGLDPRDDPAGPVSVGQ